MKNTQRLSLSLTSYIPYLTVHFSHQLAQLPMDWYSNRIKKYVLVQNICIYGVYYACLYFDSGCIYNPSQSVYLILKQMKNTVYTIKPKHVVTFPFTLPAHAVYYYL